MCGALGFEKGEKGYRLSKVSVHLQECSNAPWVGGTMLQGVRSTVPASPPAGSTRDPAQLQPPEQLVAAAPTSGSELRGLNALFAL